MAQLKASLYSLKGVAKSEIDLPATVFGAEVNPPLLAQVVRVHLANQRSGNANTLTRALINRTKAKWFKQKGTGHARHGARSAPIFVGGGIAHGPKSKSWNMAMPEKMRRKALASALSSKYADKEIVFLESVNKIDPKTREASQILKDLQLAGEKIRWVYGDTNENLVRATRNITEVNLTNASLLNPYEILTSKKILLTVDAIGILEKRIIKGNKIQEKIEEKNLEPKIEKAKTVKKTVKK